MKISIHQIIPSFFQGPIGIFSLDGDGFSVVNHDVMEDVFIKIYDVNKPNKNYFIENLGHYKWPYYTFFSSLFLYNSHSFSLSLITKTHFNGFFNVNIDKTREQDGDYLSENENQEKAIDTKIEEIKTEEIKNEEIKTEEIKKEKENYQHEDRKIGQRKIHEEKFTNLNEYVKGKDDNAQLENTALKKLS